jgi:hypothetical protein
MAHFAEIDQNGIVLRVLVVPNSEEMDGQNYLANVLGLGGNWIQTSYHGNIRKNFAGIGDTYDADRDAFIAPEPENAIGFDEEKCQWIVPVIPIE